MADKRAEMNVFSTTPYLLADDRPVAYDLIRIYELN